MTTAERIKLLTDLGLTYSEKYRNFYRPAKGRIDHDIVIYASDNEFQRHIDKLKKLK